MRYTLSQITEITGGRLIGDDRMVRNILTDSRNITLVDSLFVAICGATHNGHDYISNMAERGVNAFLVSRHITTNVGCSYVVVEDTMVALQKLATYHRLQYTGELIAITGSNAKTIIKEWFAQLWLVDNGKLLRSPRSYNSQLGVALSLLMIEGDERLVFIEAGISQAGEMERLERMIQPTLGVLTNIGDAHLCNFDSREHLAQEKMKLFDGVRHVIRADESVAEIDTRNEALVLSIYSYLGLSHRPIQELHPIAMRLELKEGVYGSTIINDTYINDIVSLGIALDYQNRLPNKRKVFVFSDFDFSYDLIAELVSSHEIDLFIGVGSEIRVHCSKFAEGSLFYASVDEFVRCFDKHLIAESSVLIKGSRRAALERICEFLENSTHTTILEVDLEAMAANLNHYRSMVAPSCRTMAMVKAFSYGSGSVEVATMLQHQKVDYLAVAFADEGVVLRQAGIHIPIVVLNSDPNSFQTMVENGLEPEIYSFSSLSNFIRVVRSNGMSQYPIHIKIDTGMHRLGFQSGEVAELNSVLQSQSSVLVSTIFSHLAVADDPSEDEFTRAQIAKFKSIARCLPAAMWHICNTSGIERFSEAHFDMVRLGIGLYISENIVSRLKSRIVQIKSVEAGQTIGYGRHGRAEQTMTIAIVPIGYADGLNRHLSRGVGRVSIHGVLCPIVGNICMDTCMVDISMIPQVVEGDEVVIFGDNPTVQQVAQWLDTIPYEVLTSVSSRIRRIYIN